MPPRIAKKKVPEKKEINKELQPNYFTSNYPLYLQSLYKNAIYVRDLLLEAKPLGRQKKMKRLANGLKFIKSFDAKGVNGIAGIVQVDQSKDFSVFKLSVEVDRTIEHEHNILKSLDTLKPYCPHFMYSYGSMQIPISYKYINIEREEECDREPQENGKVVRYSLWKDDSDHMLTNVLFIEHIQGMTFYKLSKRAHKNTIFNGMLMILSAIEIAQQKCNFVHYDLHMDNIIVRECHPDTIFVYLFNDNEALAVNTFGFCPTIIDMGSSYDGSCVNRTNGTSITNYQNGLQSSQYDKLQDIHLFMISSLESLAEKRSSPKELWVNNKKTVVAAPKEDQLWAILYLHVMEKFKMFKMWRKKGWKSLPSNILKSTVKVINDCSPGCLGNAFWRDFTIEIMDILSTLTTIPWKRTMTTEVRNKKIRETFNEFSNYLELLDDFQGLKHGRDVLVIIKEICFLVTTGVQENIIDMTLRNKIMSFANSLPQGFNVVRVSQILRDMIPLLSDCFAEFLEPNNKYIEENTKKCSIKRPYDMIKYLETFSSVRLNMKEGSQIIVWDVQKQERKEFVVTPQMMSILKINHKPSQQKKEFINLIRKM